MPERPYDVLFSMPWAGALLKGASGAGGAEAQILMVAGGLAASGLDVGLLVIAEPAEVPRRIDGVDVLTQPAPPRLRGLAGLFHDVRTLRDLTRHPARVIAQRGASRSVAVGALAARLRGAKFIFSSANVLDFELEQAERAYNVRLFEWGARRASELIVQTEEQAELCRARLGRDPVVIPSIAERADPRSGIPEAFLWVGRMTWYKGLDLYLDLARSVPEARFRAICVPTPGTTTEMVERLEHARDALPNLEVLEPLPRPEVGPLIDRAVAIVNTSRYEGMPNVFLEGWARGVPALSFDRDPDGVIARQGLGEFARGSTERLKALARAQWAARENQADVAGRCIAYVNRHHSQDAVCEAWRQVVGAVVAA